MAPAQGAAAHRGVPGLTPALLTRPDAPRVILASQSAARVRLLRDAGLGFEARPARLDEDAIKHAARAEGLDAVDTALMLADAKAARVGRAEPGALVIGADQMLVCDGIWFDKPADRDAAADQLRTLRGRTHELVTAVVCHRHGDRIWHHVARPRLTMRRFSDAFLDAYLSAEGDALLGSVGAYRLEGPGIHLFARVDGEFGAILGLPMIALLDFLRGHGVVPA